MGLLITPTYADALLIEYPDPSALAPEQRAYIEQYLADMEAALAGPDFADPNSGYAAWIDVDSFIDHHLLVELGRNERHRGPRGAKLRALGGAGGVRVAQR